MLQISRSWRSSSRIDEMAENLGVKISQGDLKEKVLQKEPDAKASQKEQDVMISPDERIDDIGFGNLRLIQKPSDFCYGVDAVILAHEAGLKADKEGTRFSKAGKIVDLGTGTGIIPVILSEKTDAESIIGIEIQEASYERAVRNATLNGLDGRVGFIKANVKEFPKEYPEFRGTADMVTSNPPYQKGNTGMRSENSPKMIARHEITADLEDFMRCTAFLLREKGDFFLIHRPSRLVDICYIGRKLGLEPKEIRFIHPYKDREANILMVHMIKGAGKELKYLEPLVVHSDEGGYTEELLKCYAEREKKQRR